MANTTFLLKICPSIFFLFNTTSIEFEKRLNMWKEFQDFYCWINLKCCCIHNQVFSCVVSIHSQKYFTGSSRKKWKLPSKRTYLRVFHLNEVKAAFLRWLSCFVHFYSKFKGKNTIYRSLVSMKLKFYLFSGNLKVLKKVKLTFKEVFLPNILDLFSGFPG